MKRCTQSIGVAFITLRIIIDLATSFCLTARSWHSAMMSASCLLPISTGGFTLKHWQRSINRPIDAPEGMLGRSLCSFRIWRHRSCSVKVSEMTVLTNTSLKMTLTETLVSAARSQLWSKRPSTTQILTHCCRTLWGYGMGCAEWLVGLNSK